MPDETPHDEQGRFAAGTDMNALLRGRGRLPEPDQAEPEAETEAPTPLPGVDAGAGRSQDLPPVQDGAARVNRELRDAVARRRYGRGS